MKFQVGDLVLVKECRYETRPHLPPLPRIHFCLPRRLDLRYVYPLLKNTYGVITEAFNHRDAWEGDSTEDDNLYFWYSQVSAKTYYFCQNDLTKYKVVK
jgi:hypothetical protein